VLSLEVGRVYAMVKNGVTLSQAEKCYPDGMMRGAGTAKDALSTENMSANIKMKDVILGNLSFLMDTTTIYGQGTTFSTVLNDKKKGQNVICQIGYAVSHQDGSSVRKYGEMKLFFGWGSTTEINIQDSRYNSVNAFKTANANNHFWYEVEDASKKTYTSLMYDTRPDLTVGEPVLVPLSTFFPGTYHVGNTGVTMQTANWDDQTQRFAATPLSAAAKTSSVMPGNYVELLRSLQQRNILDGWVSPDQFHAHQSATVQALNAMATANQLSGQFTLTPQDDVAYTNE
jgi:hypothetical protein